MISLALARKLKSAGLVWEAKQNDYFAIPDRGMDDHCFVLADIQAQLDTFRGWPVVTFHGTSEWALDYILTTEVVWIPREDQLRESILALLPPSYDPGIALQFQGKMYQCTIFQDGESRQFEAKTAAGAYAQAMLHILEMQPST